MNSNHHALNIVGNSTTKECAGALLECDTKYKPTGIDVVTDGADECLRFCVHTAYIVSVQERMSI